MVKGLILKGFDSKYRFIIYYKAIIALNVWIYLVRRDGLLQVGVTTTITTALWHIVVVNISSLFLCCLKTIDDKRRIPTVLIPSRTQPCLKSTTMSLYYQSLYIMVNINTLQLLRMFWFFSLFHILVKQEGEG